MNIVNATKWWAMERHGEVVVVLRDPRPYVIEPGVDKPWAIISSRHIHGWSRYREITEVEAETLGAIADVPTITLSQFYKWEERVYPIRNPPKTLWAKLLNIEDNAG